MFILKKTSHFALKKQLCDSGLLGSVTREVVLGAQVTERRSCPPACGDSDQLHGVERVPPSGSPDLADPSYRCSTIET